ncbi:hypothetical protein [Methylomonas sp. AM2-LC]|uniref:hypothetical protein n=1 Tax=Methylomonas sp. AM2-LC TaxID=3153301 RepID=UPI0032645434
MKPNTVNRLNPCLPLVILLISASTAQADTLDIFAGYNATTNNTYFEIQDNTGYDLTNIQFTATAAGATDTSSVEYGWTSSPWSVADIAANQQSVNYFNGTQAFQSAFAGTYANSGLTPSDLTYQFSGDLNGQLIQLTFTGGDGVSGPAFLGLDQFGNATGQTDFGQVATYTVASVPLPNAFYLFATSLIGFVVSRKQKPGIQTAFA